MKVLIADDAPMIRGRLARMVEDLPGIRTVLQSEDYAGTLKAIDAERPDAILLDMFMPGGTGLDVLRHVQQAALPPRVFMMTAWSEADMRQRCMDAGAASFFEKGAQFLDAVDAVRAMAQEFALRVSTMSTPDATGTAEPAAPSSTQRDADTGLSVMVVEDHAFQRKVLARQLRALGADTVLEAGDGEQALEQLRAADQDVQLILCDLDMPRMDGMEFMRHLGEAGSTASLIITSASDVALLNSVQMMCQAYGIRPLGVLEKPVDLGRLRTLMDQARKPLPIKAQPVAGRRPDYTLDEIFEGLRQDQFEPFFQPKVALADGRIVGAEALARWRHSEHGIVSPFAFIDPLEQSGNIDALTFLMLEKAVRACRGWRARGFDLTVSVNLSLVSLADTGLADRIAATVREIGLDPHCVTLEITETAAMTNVGAALENLARLRMRGFGLSIDDFGTGFASMQQIGRVAFSELKIDRGFVAAMLDKREARAIVESSIDMARRLGITAVAEGIETQAEWDMLKAAGCDLAQGYFVARPMEDARFVALCEQQGQA